MSSQERQFKKEIKRGGKEEEKVLEREGGGERRARHETARVTRSRRRRETPRDATDGRGTRTCGRRGSTDRRDANKRKK